MENKQLQEIEKVTKPLVEQGKNLLLKSQTMIVENDDHVCIVTENLGEIKKILKGQEDDRKKFTKPLNDVVSEINRRYKILNQPFKEADTILRGKLSIYQTTKERDRREEEERLRKEQEEKERAERKEKEKKLKKEFPDAPDDTIKDVADELTPEGKDVSVSTTKNYEGGKSKASFRTVNKFKLIDINKVARSFMILDEKAVQLAIDNGVKIIDGIEIWEEQTPVIR